MPSEAVIMETTVAFADCCPVVELRQYTLKPGQREALISLFDREFIEPQEAAGMTLVGQFRDQRREDRFVWIRGFQNMTSRHAALERFYGGPVWAAHRDAANCTMVDSDDVLLLKPARPDLAFRLDSPGAERAASARAPRIVLAGIHQLPTASDETASEFERQTVPILRAHDIAIEGVFITNSSPNTFTRLPVRENEHVLVWFGTVAGEAVQRSTVDRLAGQIEVGGRAVNLLQLEPTSRSRLGGGAAAARASKHDFDFLFGAWTIRNRFLTRRLQQSTEWFEFDATSEVTPLLDGFGHLDRYFAMRDGAPFEGVTLRLFDPATGQWSIHWADTARAGRLLPPMVGRFIGGVGEFYGDEAVDGRPVRCRFRWTRPTAESARWEQAFSEGGGTTWETNWIMSFTRR
jgi:NIPSNAP